jgi:hypothetical protein
LLGSSGWACAARPACRCAGLLLPLPVLGLAAAPVPAGRAGVALCCAFVLVPVSQTTPPARRHPSARRKKSIEASINSD